MKIMNNINIINNLFPFKFFNKNYNTFNILFNLK